MERHGVGIPPKEREENAAAQVEELEALEAIYGEALDRREMDSSNSAASSAPELRIRVSEMPLVSLHLRLPAGYPSRDFPEVDIKAPGISHSARDELRQALLPQGKADQQPKGSTEPSPSGTVVIFDWVETLRDLLSRADYNSAPAAAVGDEDGRSSPSLTSRAEAIGEGEEEEGEPLEAEAGVEEEVEISHGQAFTDRKSTFQAHLARVSSENQVVWVRRRLMENGKIARATHNVAAWRVWDELRGVQLHDNDDDGESAAGSRLAHMLAISGAQNVLVVVSRWYGGIHLGPDRFKHINNAARELLVQQSFWALMGRKRSFSCPPPRKDAGNRDRTWCVTEKARQEEKATNSVLRMLFRSPNLPAAYLVIARGLLLLATHSPTTDDSERVKAKAAWALQLDRDGLRHQAMKLSHTGAKLRARKPVVGGTLASMRAKCKQATPEMRKVVLAQLRSVENPSQVCKDLGAIVDILISELEHADDGVEEAQNNNTCNKDDNDDPRRHTTGRAHGRQYASASNGGETVDGDINNLEASAPRVRSKSVGAPTQARRFDSIARNGASKNLGGCGSWCQVRKDEALPQPPAGVVEPQQSTTNIQERCKGVLEKIELVAGLIGDFSQGACSSEAAEGEDNTTQETKATIEGMQEILNDISGTPVTNGDLHLVEDDIFEAIKQLIAWKPPPKWKRDQSRYNAQLTRAASVLLKKALIPEGPTAGFWPLSDGRIPTKARAFGVKVTLFRRREELGKAAGGGARSGGRTKRGVWSFSACSFRYASKPPILPSAV
eukprot:g13620.t1